jgi:CBS domain-containing protein
VTGIISQFGALSFLLKNLPKESLQAKLLPVVSARPVVTITKGISVYEAFHVLNQHRVSGVPVVDEQGNLVHSFSANDIKVNFQKN